MTLRKSIWAGENATGRDVGEALRDHDETLRGLPRTLRVEGTFTYAPPFYLRAKAPPRQVNLTRARPDKGPGLISSGMVEWDWSAKSGVRVKAIAGLTLGTRYLLTFELVS